MGTTPDQGGAVISAYPGSREKEKQPVLRKRELSRDELLSLVVPERMDATEYGTVVYCPGACFGAMAPWRYPMHYPTRHEPDQAASGPHRPQQTPGLAETVRTHRQRLGLTQEQLAETTGLSVRSIGKLEAGRVTTPRPTTIRMLAEAFRLTGTDKDLFCQALTGTGTGTPSGR